MKTTRLVSAAMFVLSLCAVSSSQTFFFTGAGPIPDSLGGPGSFGTQLTMLAPSNTPNPIQDVVLTITMNHTFIGDLRVRLWYQETGSGITLQSTVLNRVGAVPGNGTGNSANLNGTYVFVLGATSFFTAVQPLGGVSTLVPGAYAPVSSNLNGTHTVTEFADTFRGKSGQGTWLLIVEDGTASDVGAVTAAHIALQARPSACLSDLNADGAINTADLVSFLGSFGGTCP
ncbi:MAG: hypothetical protein ACKVZJ_09645 [Phycisphaerales bacterium]